MDIEKMLGMQKELDDRIIKEKGLEGIDLFQNTVLALQVELAEFANEGRWFKHWSNDQEPRYKAKCVMCDGLGNNIYFTGSLESNNIQECSEPCEYCDGMGNDESQNPILEEFVDGVHFFLSIAIQKGWQDSLYIYEEAIEDVREEGFDGGLTGAFLEMNYFILKSLIEKDKVHQIENALKISTQEFYFKSAWFIFICIGLIGFGFTPEQIEAAYIGKNEINHQRQDSGTY